MDIYIQVDYIIIISLADYLSHSNTGTRNKDNLLRVFVEEWTWAAQIKM